MQAEKIENFFNSSVRFHLGQIGMTKMEDHQVWAPSLKADSSLRIRPTSPPSVRQSGYQKCCVAK
ncbi:hypothetical protein M514_00438 [Trichuris suis]|uniref:Uncharacterized protein n=1 Tax=Trichuris suis TaxID=68888 RepID=A0A085NRC9_9BILA|nr:hypothetical protein M513_00438 [Trichuris suis]KFD72025.1 hypothetical protein M514_00438 [Trichuris suis]